MNKKILTALAAIPLAAMVSLNAQAAYIQTSASCPGDTSCDGTQGSYGYQFTITQDAVDQKIFYAELLNTSPNESPFALIDAFAMNMDATLDVDFTVSAFDPSSWEFRASTGGVQFDYVGDTGTPPTPGDRLLPGEALTFTFTFLNDNTSFNPWLSALESSGAGFGGGEDEGQVAVSFQQLGTNGRGSDLLTSNWGPVNPDDPNDPNVPEPATVLLMGLGFLGFGASRLKAKKS